MPRLRRGVVHITDCGARLLAAAVLRTAYRDYARRQRHASAEKAARPYLVPGRIDAFWQSDWAETLADLAGVDRGALRRLGL